MKVKVSKVLEEKFIRTMRFEKKLVKEIAITDLAL